MCLSLVDISVRHNKLVCLSNVEVSVRFYKLVCLSVVTDIYFWLDKLTCFLIRDVSEWNRLVCFSDEVVV